MKGDNYDVGFIDDILFGIEHAIGAEEHCKQSFVMDKDERWLDILKKIRRERSKLMYRIVPQANNESYCTIKHMLGWAMSLKEIGDRYLEERKKNLAKECFELAQLLESVVKLLIGGTK